MYEKLHRKLCVNSMEENIACATKADRAILYDIEQLHFFIQRVSELMETLSSEAASHMIPTNALCKSADGEEILSPGFPGYHKNAMMAIASAIVDLMNNLNRFGVGSLDQVQTLSTQVATSRERLKKLLDACKAAKVQYDMAKTMVKQLAPDEQTRKIDALITKLSKSSRKSEKKLKKLRELWFNVLVSRKGTDCQREGIIVSADDAVTRFEKNFVEFREIVDKLTSDFFSVFDWVVTVYMDIALALHKCAEDVINLADPSVIRDDIKKFVADRKIVRYDLPIPAFEVCEGDDGEVPKDITPDYPVALARVTEDFIAGGENELTCVQGKTLLLMEIPRDGEDWCCAMNPFTHAIGYVPTYCVEMKGSCLGLCVRDPKQGEAQGVLIKIGDFFAITENEPKNKMMTIETIHGDVGTVSRAIVAIVYI